MVSRVVFVNSVKTEPIPLLETDPAVDLTVVTEARFADRYATGTDVRIVTDIGDLVEVRDAVVATLEGRGPFDRVVTASERSLQAGGYLRSFFGLDGNGFDVVNAFTNKHVMKRRLAAAGIAVASHALVAGPGDVAGAARWIGWPVVVKPVLGAGAMDTSRVDGPDELDAWLASPTASRLKASRMPLLVERCLDVRAEYHCDAVVVDGEVRFFAASRYFAPLLGVLDRVNGSATLPDAEPLRAPLTDLHARAVTALGLRSGVTHLEVFDTPDGLVAGEIACRPAGGGLAHNLRLAYGVDLWRCFLDIELGCEPKLPAARPASAIHMVCDLPVVPGRIREITSIEDLKRLPDVVDAHMISDTGDVHGGVPNSGDRAGSVFLALDGENLVAERLAAVERTYRVTVEPISVGAIR